MIEIAYSIDPIKLSLLFIILNELTLIFYTRNYKLMQSVYSCPIQN